MRKLLLFALTMGLSAMTFAQTDGLISVDNYVLPTGTIILEDPANGNTSISVTITNNTTDTIPDLSNLFFYVTIDGTKIKHPSTGADAWGFNLIDPLAIGASTQVQLTNEWGAVAPNGTNSLCIELYQYVTFSGPDPGFHPNVDANKQICEDFLFSFPASISDFSDSKISKIVTNGDVMKVYFDGATSSQIKMMNITGQVVKTINTNVTGNNSVENIDISDVTPGVYIVTIQSENGTASAKKVFIQ